MYDLSGSQIDRIRYDESVRRYAPAMLESLTEEEALQVDPSEYAEVGWENEMASIEAGDVMVNDIEEAKARFEDAFVESVKDWQRSRVADNLNDELWQKDTGYTTCIEVAPATELSNPAAIEIVVLDYDGDTIAYRYSDDSIDHDWQLGEVQDAVQEWLDLREVQFERQMGIERCA